MSQPVVVSIPHRLGKEEALRRLKSGLSRTQDGFGGMKFVEQSWADDQFKFSVAAFGQTASGAIDVADDHVRIALQLPWLLAQFAEQAKALMQRQGELLLEKK